MVDCEKEIRFAKSNFTNKFQKVYENFLTFL